MDNINNSENEFENMNNNSEEPDGENGGSVSMELYDWAQCFISALVAGILIFLFVFRVITVDGSSMNNTLVNGDKIIITSLFYTPKNGDIVVLKAPDFSDSPLVKRVIATEGQTVNIDFDAGIVYVDGKALEEPYIAQPTYDREDFTGEVTVPEGCIFVMGDNRNASTDSRTDEIGMIDTREVFGKVQLIIIPGTGQDNRRDWSRIGSVY